MIGILNMIRFYIKIVHILICYFMIQEGLFLYMIL